MLEPKDPESVDGGKNHFKTVHGLSLLLWVPHFSSLASWLGFNHLVDEHFPLCPLPEHEPQGFRVADLVLHGDLVIVWEDLLDQESQAEFLRSIEGFGVVPSPTRIEQELLIQAFDFLLRQEADSQDSFLFFGVKGQINDFFRIFFFHGFSYLLHLAYTDMKKNPTRGREKGF
jgi:hypothetical protein